LRIKFDIISKQYDIFKIFTTSEKCFPPKIKGKNTFLEIKPNFSLIKKCFLLTNFPNGKQTEEGLKNSFPEITFQETNVPLNDWGGALVNNVHIVFLKNSFVVIF
jgi:hypothetical protein